MLRCVNRLKVKLFNHRKRGRKKRKGKGNLRFFPFPSRLSLSSACDSLQRVRTGRREERVSFSSGCRLFNQSSGRSPSLFKTSSLIKGFSPYFDFFGRDKVRYLGLDRSTWKERKTRN